MLLRNFVTAGPCRSAVTFVLAAAHWAARPVHAPVPSLQQQPRRCPLSVTLRRDALRGRRRRAPLARTGGRGSMHPRVRGLYKQFLFMADYHPTMAPEVFREKVRAKFLENNGVAEGSDEYKRALGYGRYMLKEMEALIHLHKYRGMRKRYEDGDDK